MDYFLSNNPTVQVNTSTKLGRMWLDKMCNIDYNYTYRL